jgi:hypothetical protein
MLEVVHTLIKYAQRWDVFICEFLDVMRSTKVKLYRLYVNPLYKYDYSTFNEFIVVCEHHNELLSLMWASHEPLIDLYMPPLYLAFNIVGQSYGLHHHGGSIGVYVHMNLIYQTMKATCLEVVSNLYFDLFHRFLDVEIMAILGMVYPQYWLCEETIKFFFLHLDQIKSGFKTT